MNRRAVGSKYEQMAKEWLKKQGLTILAQNFRSRTGEIDLIARDERTIIFVEVKYRSSVSAGDPAEAVSWQKQMKIRNTARY
ncbi:MAG: YraN family protein [Lachnospiraceae bacterium]